jgi:hypothetical protein
MERRRLLRSATATGRAAGQAPAGTPASAPTSTAPPTAPSTTPGATRAERSPSPPEGLSDAGTVRRPHALTALLTTETTAQTAAFADVAAVPLPSSRPPAAPTARDFDVPADPWPAPTAPGVTAPVQDRRSTGNAVAGTSRPRAPAADDGQRFPPYGDELFEDAFRRGVDLS